MATNAFGTLLKRFRHRTGLTLREFCQKHGIDAGNFSRLERGRFPAPQKTELLERYAGALELKPGSDDWTLFFDTAAASRGEIPRDLLEDDELLEKLPALFRTLRGKPIDQDKLDDFIEAVRRT